MIRRVAFAAALAMLAVAAPSSAQPSPAALALGQQAYAATAPGGNADAASAFLRDALNSTGAGCRNVTAFQLFARASAARTLKVECGTPDLLIVTLDPGGRVLASGGDGSVSPFDPKDGPLIKVDPVFTDDEGVGGGSAAQAAAENAPVATEGGTSPTSAVADAASRYWKRVAVVIGLVVGVAVLFFLYRALKSERMLIADDPMRWKGLSSTEKDRMVEEAREVYPDIHAHPGGVFIVKGRRGKRRLFSTLMFAYLYRSFGWKFGQIR